jgi:hypothetical protein
MVLPYGPTYAWRGHFVTCAEPREVLPMVARILSATIGSTNAKPNTRHEVTFGWFSGLRAK